MNLLVVHPRTTRDALGTEPPTGLEPYCPASWAAFLHSGPTRQARHQRVSARQPGSASARCRAHARHARSAGELPISSVQALSRPGATSQQAFHQVVSPSPWPVESIEGDHRAAQLKRKHKHGPPDRPREHFLGLLPGGHGHEGDEEQPQAPDLTPCLANYIQHQVHTQESSVEHIAP